ncbi:sensor histidine kinase [Polaribacter pacificus]|uniref:sensor histidine kinase n=1 Tax=Polaribacter pacificus TaxID=1775173 RepID=UPI00166B9269|nr:HAMP domain-containing sensor histidine kinase [Polaribacter pacificus]
MLVDDFSLSLPADKQKSELQKKMALLLEKSKRRAFAQASESIVFTTIIESFTTGILILRRDQQKVIEVYQMNTAFTNFLQIPRYYHWDLLKNKIKPLVDIIQPQDWQTLKHVISLRIDGQEETFYLKTAITKTKEFDYYIISLETLQQLIDKKEKESWYRLLNVMSHEIINTITPISSLASNLGGLLSDDEPDAESLEELSKGLEIIKKRSIHLTDFVSTYRKLAELPLPIKNTVDIVLLANNTLLLFKDEFKKQQIITNLIAPDSLFLNIDQNQIEQVFINLISNCLYALQNTDNPSITITMTQNNSRVHITFTDNGIGVSNEIKNNLFVPYFTTRKEGSGIGLTLSKNIMEAHQGSISFASKDQQTSFVLTFLT